MEIVDGQLHEFSPALPWSGRSGADRDDVLTEVLLAAMTAVGVHGAVLFPTADLGWALDLASRQEDRFAVVPMITTRRMQGAEAALNPLDADFDDRVSELLDQPGVRAFRVVASKLDPEASRLHGLPPETPEQQLEAGAYDGVFSTCQQRGVPIFLSVVGRPDRLIPVAERYPDLVLVLDHLGLVQVPQQVPDPWDEKLPQVLDLARFPNVNIKLSGLPGFSAQPFPFADVHRQAAQVIDTFGAHRVLWASDISRFQGRIGWSFRYPHLEGGYPGRHTYAESVQFMTTADWLSPTDKEMVLGQTVRSVLHWPKVAPGQ